VSIRSVINRHVHVQYLLHPASILQTFEKGHILSAAHMHRLLYQIPNLMVLCGLSPQGKLDLVESRYFGLRITELLHLMLLFEVEEETAY
jgi:hypothetical protein